MEFIINQYKDPYETTSIMESIRVFFSWLMSDLKKLGVTQMIMGI